MESYLKHLQSTCYASSQAKYHVCKIVIFFDEKNIFPKKYKKYFWTSGNHKGNARKTKNFNWHFVENLYFCINYHAMKIFLTGFMGSGKTTVGKRMADVIGFDFVDTDLLIEQGQGMSVSAIFAALGEDAFRKMDLF